MSTAHIQIPGSYLPYVPRYALMPKRDGVGRPIPGRFVPYWGGRGPSKYDPATEDAKHKKAGK
jgi:hypothetical protein